MSHRVEVPGMFSLEVWRRIEGISQAPLLQSVADMTVILGIASAALMRNMDNFLNLSTLCSLRS